MFVLRGTDSKVLEDAVKQRNNSCRKNWQVVEQEDEVAAPIDPALKHDSLDDRSRSPIGRKTTVCQPITVSKMLLRGRVFLSRDQLRRCSLATRCLSSRGSPSDEQKWRTQVMPALETFCREMGHCAIDEDFEVPATCLWPPETWGLPLGRVVRDIRESRAYVDQVARARVELELLHFPWVYQAAVWNDRILPALKAYASEFGHCRVPFMFAVPSRDPWPRSAWGMNLGTMVASMRGMGSYFAYVGRDADRLELLGDSLELSTRVWKTCIAPLLEVYATVFGEEVPVRADFVIPREDPWPEEMWGVRLGMIVARNSRFVVRK